MVANGYPAWYPYHGPDFGLTPLNPAVNPDVHSFDQGPITVNGAGEYIVYVQCWDFGGRTRLVAVDPANPAISAEVWIPKGSGANGIGSAWIHDSGQVRLNPNADIDAIVFEKPGRFAPLGDGYNNLQDYRGIVYTPSVGGPLNHLRLNPYRKDLFVRPVGFDAEYPFAMGNALLNAGIDVHDISAWGHDATEDGRFFRYHQPGNRQCEWQQRERNRHRMVDALAGKGMGVQTVCRRGGGMDPDSQVVFTHRAGARPALCRQATRAPTSSANPCRTSTC